MYESSGGRSCGVDLSSLESCCKILIASDCWSFLISKMAWMSVSGGLAVMDSTNCLEMGRSVSGVEVFRS